VGGESVADGFAIEIEDRGLGMSPQRLDELNERLANPPDLNPANTEQLGLFVVGQLARRHGISVTLRPSPYGGTTAVALIPSALIVEEGPAAITTGGSGAAGAGSYGGRGAGAPNGAAAGPYAGATTGGFPSSGAGTDTGAFITGAFGGGPGGPGRPGGPEGPGAPGGSRADHSGSASLPPTPGAGNDWPGANGWPSSSGPAEALPRRGSGRSNGAPGAEASRPAFGGPNGPNGPNGPTSSTGGIRISGALRHPGPMPGGPGPNGANRAQARPGLSDTGSRRAARHGTDDVQVVTGVPVSRPTGGQGALEPPFDVFTPIQRPDQDPATTAFPADVPYPQSYPDFGGQASSAPHPSPQSDSGVSDLGAMDFGNAGTADDGYGDGDADGDDYKGLPRRVRQANLAPELRASAAAASSGPAGVPRASAESLSVMRNTLSAMQRGWQQGRSDSQGDTEGNVDGD
jgi:hypothetical protein